MPLTHTPTTSRPESASNSLLTTQTSCHQIDSASCSTQPGRGIEVTCGRTAVASTVPSSVASTPFVLDVPMSMPSNAFMTGHPRFSGTHCSGTWSTSCRASLGHASHSTGSFQAAPMPQSRKY